MTTYIRIDDLLGLLRQVETEAVLAVDGSGFYVAHRGTPRLPEKRIRQASGERPVLELAEGMSGKGVGPIDPQRVLVLVPSDTAFDVCDALTSAVKATRGADVNVEFNFG